MGELIDITGKLEAKERIDVYRLKPANILHAKLCKRVEAWLLHWKSDDGKIKQIETYDKIRPL